MSNFNNYNEITNDPDITHSELDQKIAEFKAKGGKIKKIEKIAFAKGLILSSIDKIPLNNTIVSIPFNLIDN